MGDLRFIIESWYETLLHYTRADTNHLIEIAKLRQHYTNEDYRTEEQTKETVDEIRAEEKYTLEGFEEDWRAIREDLNALKKDWGDL